MHAIFRLLRGNGRRCEELCQKMVSRIVNSLLQYRIKIASSYGEKILHSDDMDDAENDCF